MISKNNDKTGSHIEVFQHYYERGFWADATGSSGPNSAYHLTPILRSNLTNLLHDLKVRSLLDAGCGDANLFRYIDLKEIDYFGIDCVPSMIAKNQLVFNENPKMQFCVGDVVTCKLPTADLILCRDVVHYLTTDLIWRLLQNFVESGSRYLLITHNTHSALSANSPTEVGVFRPVNLCQLPFQFPTPILTISEDVFAKELALWEVASLLSQINKVDAQV